jgi:hypothetical protein
VSLNPQSGAHSKEIAMTNILTEQAQNIVDRIRASHDARCAGTWEAWTELTLCDSPAGFGTVKLNLTFDGCRTCGAKVARPE